MTEPSKRTVQRRIRAWYADLFKDLPENFTPLEAVVSVRCLNDEGEICLFTAKTAGLTPWDAYGQLAYALDDFSSSSIHAATEDE